MVTKGPHSWLEHTSRRIHRAQFSARGPVELASQVPPGKMMLPGAMALTRTFLDPAIRANSLVMWFIAALDVP